MARGLRPPGRSQTSRGANYFFFSAAGAAFLSLRSRQPCAALASPRRAGSGFLARALGGGSGAFGAFFLLLFDHLDFAGSGGGFGGRGGFLFLGARQRPRMTTEMFLSPRSSTPAGALMSANMNRLADFKMADIHDQLLPADPSARRGP